MDNTNRKAPKKKHYWEHNRNILLLVKTDWFIPIEYGCSNKSIWEPI